MLVCLFCVPAHASEAGYAAEASISASVISTAAGLVRVKSVRYSASGGVETVTINLERYVDVHSFYLAEPGRFVIDLRGAGLPSGQQLLEVGKGSVQRVRFGMFDVETARFVIDLSKNAEFTVKAGKGYIKAEATTGAEDAEPIICVPEAGGAPGFPDALFTANSPSDESSADESSVDESSANVSSQGTSAGSGFQTEAADNTQMSVDRTPRPVRTPRISPSPSPRRRATPRVSPPPVQSPPPGQTPSPIPEQAVIPPPIITKDEFRLDITSEFKVIVSSKDGINACAIEMPRGLIEKARIINGEGTSLISVEAPYSLPGSISGAKTMSVNSDVIKQISVSQPDANSI